MSTKEKSDNKNLSVGAYLIMCGHYNHLCGSNRNKESLLGVGL